MQILADYHTHTIYSHGRGTIEDNVKSAISKNIKVLGISDHSYSHKVFGVKKDNICKMRDEVNRLNDKYGGRIQLLLGLECNILDDLGSIDCDDKTHAMLDYVLAGYHFGVFPTNIHGFINAIDNRFISSFKAKEYNTYALINAMNNNDIFAITHPGDKGDVYIEEVAKEAKCTNTLLEINSSHGFLSLEQLKLIKDVGNKFIIGSDAHYSKNVGDFANAIYIIKKSGIDLNRIENIKL